MKLYKISYLSNSSVGLCANDFKSDDRHHFINLKYVESISLLEMFIKPFSGEEVGLYSTITMKTGDRYFIRKSQYDILLNKITTGNHIELSEYAKKKLEYIKGHYVTREFPDHNDVPLELVGAMMDLIDELKI